MNNKIQEYELTDEEIQEAFTEAVGQPYPLKLSPQDLKVFRYVALVAQQKMTGYVSVIVKEALSE